MKNIFAIDFFKKNIDYADSPWRGSPNKLKKWRKKHRKNRKIRRAALLNLIMDIIK